MTSSDLNQPVSSTIGALDEFEQIIELQELVKLAHDQLENSNFTTKDKTRTDLLISIYLKDTSEYMINVKKYLEEVQAYFWTISNNGYPK